MSTLALQYKYLNDKIAIGLSMACAAHCLLMPSFVLAIPLFFSGQLDNEFLHRLMLWVIVPVSLYALSSGYKKHKKDANFSSWTCWNFNAYKCCYN